MATFKTVLRGYDKREVDRFIQSVELRRGAVDDTYQERISALNEENRRLQERISTFEDERDLLSSGLLKLAKLEEESTQRIKERELLEKERLELFGERWKEYARGVIQDEGRNVEEAINQYLREYTRLIKEDLKEIGINKGKESNACTAKEEEKLRDLCISLGILEE